MKNIDEIIYFLNKYYGEKDIELVKKAYDFAVKAHEGQVRLSGEDYVSHPIEVAYTLAEMRMDGATVAAGLLHDTVEDTKATIEEIDELFGEEVADIVDGVTKISLLSFDSKEEQQAENIRKMLLAMNEDMRVLFVKLADRLHNMTTLDHQKPDKQRRIAKETMDIYAPLANRLGMHRLKLLLEDLSFKYISPDSFYYIYDWLERNKTDDIKHIEEVKSVIKNIMLENGIDGDVKGRIKHVYSIYRKMTAQNVSIDNMHDIIAFRAIVDSIKDCYALFGFIHATWTPVPGRFKDYISMPKKNMYQSLHTTVIGPRGDRMEIQIRTKEMDKLAEFGHASHWLYKEGARVKSKDIREFSWLREMLDWQKMESNSKEFLNSLRFDLFKDEIYVFTPNGEVKELPEDATPIDFAYLIHTDLGSHCSGSRVNGKLVPLSTKLKSGDTIEIITDPNRHPSNDWLNFVKTAKARTRIQHYIKTKERSRSIALGRELLEKTCRRHNINFTKTLKTELFESVVKDLKYTTVDDLISAVGYSKITALKVVKLLQPKSLIADEEALAKEQAKLSKVPEKDTGISISGVGDILTKLARCCNPVPGDPIVGFSSRGRGVIIHREDCPSLAALEPERLLAVHWDGVKTQKQIPFPAGIKVVSLNKPGLLAMVSAVINAEGANIDSGSIRSTVDGKSEMEFVVQVEDVTHLLRILGKLRATKDILEVIRRLN